MTVRILPSILSADLARLQEEVDSIADADGFQVDVMDGHFVPNLSFGAPVVRCLRTSLPMDVHLMVSNPADRVAEFLALHPAQITFHAEAVPDAADRAALIAAIRNGGASAGIALNPETPLSAIDDVVDDIDLVLIMSVHPGFGGQEFLPEVLDKVRALRARRPDVTIQMDGGVSPATAPDCIAAGADSLVAGSAVFSASDRSSILSAFRHG